MLNIWQTIDEWETHKRMARKNTLTELKTRERQDRKNLIVDAAEHVFGRKPFNQVSMREIADEAGIAVSSIYTYFKNQEMLFVEVALREINRMIEGVEDISRQDIPDEMKLESIISSFLEYVINRDSYFRMMTLFTTQGGLHGESLEQMNDIMKLVFDHFDDIFARLGYHGHMRKLSHLFFAALNGILVTYRKLPGRPENELVSHMLELGKVLKTIIVSACAYDCRTHVKA
jgi:AcrR family transcriptional regulator